MAVAGFGNTHECGLLGAVLFNTQPPSNIENAHAVNSIAPIYCNWHLRLVPRREPTGWLTKPTSRAFACEAQTR